MADEIKDKDFKFQIHDSTGAYVDSCLTKDDAEQYLEEMREALEPFTPPFTISPAPPEPFTVISHDD